MIDKIIGLIEPILPNAAWFALGSIATGLWKLVTKIVPTKRLWQLSSASSFVVCVSTSVQTPTGQYTRPATGIGQLRALGITVESLRRGYRSVRTKNIFLSTDPMAQSIEEDMLLLGGEKNNGRSRKLLDHLSQRGIVDQTKDTFIWKRDGNNEMFTPVLDGGTVTRDVGLVVRMRNPFATKKTTVVLLAGGHTYGTIAAARYFTEDVYSRVRSWRQFGRNLAFIVTCDVSDGHPVAIKCVKRCRF